MLRPGFRIPADVLPSLRDAIEPGPAAGEVRRLEEALAVERERVNALLRLEPAPGPAERPATPFGAKVMPCTCVPTADGGLRRRTDIDCPQHPDGIVQGGHG